jgi:hypothetical protein
MGLIRDILAACDDITYHYISSKQPKFIRSINFKHSMKKIDKLIDKLNSSDITGLVVEYMEVLLELHPPFGRFEHCVSVKLINERYSSTFEYDILKTNRDKYHIIADVYQIPNGGFENSCSIKIHIYHNGLKTISFFIPLEELTPKIIEDPNRIEAISAEARIEFGRIIQYDIVQFFKEYQKNCKAKVEIDGC